MLSTDEKKRRVNVHLLLDYDRCMRTAHPQETKSKTQTKDKAITLGLKKHKAFVAERQRFYTRKEYIVSTVTGSSASNRSDVITEVRNTSAKTPNTKPEEASSFFFFDEFFDGLGETIKGFKPNRLLAADFCPPIDKKAKDTFQPGATWAFAKDFFKANYPDGFDSKAFNKRIALYPNNIKELASKGYYCEENKRVLIYFQMHYLASVYGIDALNEFDFFDDNESILKVFNQFIKPQHLPPNSQLIVLLDDTDQEKAQAQQIVESSDKSVLDIYAPITCFAISYSFAKNKSWSEFENFDGIFNTAIKYRNLLLELTKVSGINFMAPEHYGTIKLFVAQATECAYKTPQEYCQLAEQLVTYTMDFCHDNSVTSALREKIIELKFQHLADVLVEDLEVVCNTKAMSGYIREGLKASHKNKGYAKYFAAQMLVMAIKQCNDAEKLFQLRKKLISDKKFHWLRKSTASTFFCKTAEGKSIRVSQTFTLVDKCLLARIGELVLPQDNKKNTNKAATTPSSVEGDSETVSSEKSKSEETFEQISVQQYRFFISALWCALMIALGFYTDTANNYNTLDFKDSTKCSAIGNEVDEVIQRRASAITIR